MNESAHLFGSAAALTGILTRAAPSSETSRPAVLLLNSGIVHRVGPNRLYVAIARRLAELGFPAFRFDFSSLGDSPPRRDHLPLDESCVEETSQAMDLVQAETGHVSFVLAGICSGADAALATAVVDSRVRGVAAINARRFGVSDDLFPEVRQRALARHYRRLAASRSFGGHSVGRFSRGKLGFKDVLRAVRSQIPHSLGRRDFGGGTYGLGPVLDRGAAVYCLHSEADEGLDHLQVLMGKELPRLRTNNRFRFEVLDGADHTFTMRWSQVELLRRLEGWMQGAFSAGGPVEDPEA